MNGQKPNRLAGSSRAWHLEKAGGNLFFLQSIIEHTSISGNSRVLDIGCGTGLLASYLQMATGAEVIGTEISSEMIEIAIARGIKCVYCPTGKLDPSIGNFDLIYCKEVLPSIRDKQSFFEMVFGCLNSKGSFISYIPDELDRYEKPLFQFIEGSINESKQSYLDLEENIRIMDACGFEEILQKRLSLGTVQMDKTYINKHRDGYFSNTEHSSIASKRLEGLNQLSELIKRASEDGLGLFYEFERTLIMGKKP